MIIQRYDMRRNIGLTVIKSPSQINSGCHIHLKAIRVEMIILRPTALVIPHEKGEITNIM